MATPEGDPPQASHDIFDVSRGEGEVDGEFEHLRKGCLRNRAGGSPREFLPR